MSQLYSAFENLQEQIAYKLSQTVLALESNEVIEQMRNDKMLQELKLNAIKEVIAETMNLDEEMLGLARENARLRAAVTGLEEALVNKDREFAKLIDNIEDSANQLTRNKEEEISKLAAAIRALEAKLAGRDETLAGWGRKYADLQSKLDETENEKEKSKREIAKCKEEILRLSENNKKLKTNQKEVEGDNQKAFNTIKAEYQKQIQEYENLVKKMQNDMIIIKTQWQKKCNDVEKQLRQFYEGELVRLEQKKSRQLLQHIETIKEGKPIVIKQDQEIVTSRLQSVRRQYEAQIEKLTRNNQDLQQMYESLQSAHIPKTKQLQSLTQSLKSIRAEFQDQKESWANEKEKSRKQIEKLKSMLQQLDKSNKQSALNLQSKQSEITKLNDNMKFVEKKLQIANRNVQELKSQLGEKQEDMQKFKNKYSTLEDLNKKMKKNIDQLENQLESKNKKIEGANRQIEKVNEKVIELQEKQKQNKDKVKRLKNNKQVLKKTLDKVYVQVKQYQKQLELARTDIKYAIQIHKKKHFADIQKLLDQVEVHKESIQKQTKNKINDLINEIEQTKQAQNVEFQELVRQRENLKREVVELEGLLMRKDKQIEEAKRATVNSQTQQVRRTMIEQIKKQRIRYQQLEENFLRSEKQNYRILEKTKIEVKDAIKVLTNKWTEQLARLEEDNRKKQTELQKIIEKVQVVINQSQTVTKNLENQKQQSRKFRKKYENLKQQKQEQISDLIKRLEKENKHKISLQKQLRAIKSELNKGDRSFKQFSERENKNGFNYAVTDREKQITQIRELIAKTYQAVGQRPEKDRAQLKRSPY